MKEYSDEPQLVTPEYYRERVLDVVIKKAGKWITYYEKNPIYLDVRTSLNKLEKLINEIK